VEYFRIVNKKTTEQKIHKYLTLTNLDKFSSEIFNLKEPTENESDIGGIWGEFTLIRNKIKGGCRFALMECPNALCWTVTTGYPPKPESIVVHLTINRTEKDPEFIEEIIDFLDDMCQNLRLFFSEEKMV
jgi:hypothetical protein